MNQPVNNCAFCRIISGDLPAKIVYQDELATVFQDIHPIAPIHLLVIPNQHLHSLNQISEADATLLGHLLMVAKRMAHEYSVDESGYRVIINTGPDAGQSVFHVHVHLLGGRRLSFGNQ